MNDLNALPFSCSIKGKAKSLSDQEVACDHCGMFGMCEEAGLSRNPQLLERVVRRRTVLAVNAELFHAKAPFQYLYAVKSGSFATLGVDGEGKRKVLGFYFHGDLLGLDAIESGYYHNTVVALEKSSVCKLDYESINLLGEHQSSFKSQLIAAMSSRLRYERWTAMLLSIPSTEQRMAAFLVYLASHLKARGLAHIEFRLPMSRHDIADHLGMAMETVSRTLSVLQKKGILVLKGRNTRISRLEELFAMAGLEHPAEGVLEVRY